MTPASTTIAYCTPAQALQYFDPNQWGDYLTDTTYALTAAQLLTSPILAALLLEASGEIEEATACGGRYKLEDLQALVGTAAGEKLARMTAGIAFWNANLRRYREAEMSEGIYRIYESLDRLRTGMAVFSFRETQAAGLPTTQRWYDDLEDLRSSPVWEARRMFGDRHLTRH